MSVELQPQHTLGFHRPLTQLVKRTLTIANTQKIPVAFKVKTTAPKQYCVRPNSGRIEPGEKIEVQVLLQPMREDPAPDTKCRDKFLVQSAAITAERESLGLTEMWAALEAEAKADKSASQINEQKIRCAYLSALEGSEANDEESTAHAYEGHNGLANGVDPSRASPSHDDQTMQDANNSAFGDSQRDSSFGAAAGSQTTTAKPFSQIVSESRERPAVETLNEARNTVSTQTVAAGSAVAAAASAAGATVANKVQGAQSGATAIPAEKDDESAVVSALRKQLASAQAEIESLKMQLKDGNGLRQRTGGIAKPAQDPSQQLAQSLKAAQNPGVPIEMVAAIVFGTFVFTWLFL